MGIDNKTSLFLYKIAYVKYQYYNRIHQRLLFKIRPMLLIESENKVFPTDFTALPISSIKQNSYINPKYDVDIGKNVCPKLTTITYDRCFVRVNKPLTIHSRDIRHQGNMDNLATTYQTKFDTIKLLWYEFSSNIFK